MTAPRVTVAVATFNRGTLLRRLLTQLAAQTLPPDQFEVVLIDDGSRTPAAAALEGLQLPYGFQLLRQENAGAASARHEAVRRARGEVVVITDDDMQVPATFLASHLSHHGPGSRAVVLGEIRPDPDVDMPLFERFHADSLQRQAAKRRSGREELHGNSLCTGNVSFRGADYHAVGGFDLSLERSEDAELGLRFERAGLDLIFDTEAYVLHSSDHSSLQQWLGRAYRYGRFDQRISDKYPEYAHADPYRYLFKYALAKRPFLAATLVAPQIASPAARALMAFGDALSGLGFEEAALRAAGLAFGLQYFRGMRDEAGSLRSALRRAWSYGARRR